MPSAFIPSVLSYPAMPLAEQQVHQRYVQPGPLVLRSALLKFPTPVIDRDRTVSRRSEPSSRTALMGEQPNPFRRRPPQSNCPPDSVPHPDSRVQVRTFILQEWYPNIDSLTPGGISSLSPTYPVHVIQKFNIKLQ